MADYILRDDAIQCAKDQADDFNNENLFSSAEGALAVAEWLKDVPAADVRPVVRAVWVPVAERWHEYPFYKCSACGAKSGFSSHFCPNCGADMREVKEDG